MQMRPVPMLAVRRRDGVGAHVDDDRQPQLQPLRGGGEEEGGRRQAAPAPLHALLRPLQDPRRLVQDGAGEAGPGRRGAGEMAGDAAGPRPAPRRRVARGGARGPAPVQAGAVEVLRLRLLHVRRGLPGQGAGDGARGGGHGAGPLRGLPGAAGAPRRAPLQGARHRVPAGPGGGGQDPRRQAGRAEPRQDRTHALRGDLQVHPGRAAAAAPGQRRHRQLPAPRTRQSKGVPAVSHETEQLCFSLFLNRGRLLAALGEVRAYWIVSG